MNRKDHWDKTYARKRSADQTWHQEEPTVSLALIRQMGLGPEAWILDVGGGTSHLASFLLGEGFQNVSVLDISGEALEIAKKQVGSSVEEVEWYEADILDIDLPRRWALWHDRAVFHFLTSPGDRERYLAALSRGLEPGGQLIIATFALDGPTRCSGLEVVRHSPHSLAAILGPEYVLRGSVPEAHRTPAGGTQKFVYSWFQRVDGG